jgi:hypothetical protein
VNVTVIPFYGADDPEMFAIERRAMDRDGLVPAALDALLPHGRVLDVGLEFGRLFNGQITRFCTF